MQKVFYTLAPVALLALTGCAGAMYQQTPAPAPSLTEIQGRCFAQFKKFAAQTKCIANAVTASGIMPDPYTQEYLAYMQSLQEKVTRKALSENDARLKLASKLNEQRARQENELAVQEQLDMQRSAQNAEILRQYQANIRQPAPYQPVMRILPSPIVVNPAPQYQTPPVQAYQLPKPIVTDCRGVGNQVLCTTGEHY